jgi:hypothetical protein
MKKTFFILSTVFVLALTGCADPVNYVEQTLTTAAANQESEEVEIAEVPLMLRAIETTEDEPIEETPELIIEEPEEEVVVAEPTEPETTNTEVVNELEVTDEQQRAIDRRVLDCLAKLYGKTSPKYSLSWLCQYEGIVIFSKSGENTNHIKCTMENLQKAADVLGVSADYLINGEI